MLIEDLPALTCHRQVLIEFFSISLLILDIRHPMFRKICAPLRIPFFMYDILVILSSRSRSICKKEKGKNISIDFH